MTAPRPKWYQFSLKSLLLLITLGAVWFVVYQMWIGRDRATVAALQKAGAALQFTGPHGGSSIVPERVVVVSVPTGADAAEIIRIARDLPHLAGLNLNDSNVQDTDLSMLASYPSLTSVNITSTGITDKGLVLLQNVKTLKHVYIGDAFLSPEAIGGLETALPGCRVIGRSLQPLSEEQHAALRQIQAGGGYVSYDEEGYVRQISWHPLDEERLALIATFPTVAYLDLSSFMGQQVLTPVTDSWLESIGRMKYLQTLRLSGPEVSDQGLSYLADLTDLRELHLAAGAATGERVRPWSSMPSLRWLSIEGAKLTTLDFIPAMRNGAVEALTLRCPKLTSLPFRDWTSLEHLHRLELECPELKAEALAEVTFPKSLKSVVFSRMSFEASGFACLDEVERLDRLVLRDCQLSSDAWEAVNALSPADANLNLQGTPPPDDHAVAETLDAFTSIRIFDVKLTDDHLAALAAMPQLISMNVDQSDLSSADVTKFGQFRQLRNLRFWGSPITEEAAATLRELLPECEIEIR